MSALKNFGKEEGKPQLVCINAGLTQSIYEPKNPKH